MKGLIHIYTGDGKGKTTAAVGMALRAAGNGMRVVFVQFLKGTPSGEVSLLSIINGITVLRNTEDFEFFRQMTGEQKQKVTRMHNENLSEALRLVEEGHCDMLVLDEVLAACLNGTVDAGKIEGLLDRKPEALELVLTGRDAPPSFIERADYVSEIKKIKHPYDRGIGARKGIER